MDNIIDQFNKLNNSQSQVIDTMQSMIDLREKSGETIYADDYIELGERQLALAEQNRDAYEALTAEMNRQNIKEGSDEWKEYNDQLQDYKNNMISAAEAVESYKDAMTDLVYKTLDDFKSKMDTINDTISTMNNLIGSTNLIDDDGALTDRGLAQVALYAQQLANSKQEAAEYAEAMESLEEALDSGLITQDEYNERLADYQPAQNSAVEATKQAKDSIIELVQEGIQAEIDAMKERTDALKDALEAEQDLHDYQESIKDKQSSIEVLQKNIAALAGSTDRADIAQRLQLQQELADAEKDLYETQYDHSIEQQKDALDKEYESFEKEKQEEMDELESNLDAQNAAIEKYLNEVKSNYSTVYKVLTQYGDEYSLAAIEDLTSPWESGSEAANLCADAMGEAIANINYDIANIDMSPLYELIEALNSLSSYGLGEGSGGSGNYEDVTGQGKWQQNSKGWWYGNSDDDYVSDGYYNISGKTYGFNSDGYMIQGWDDSQGDWHYFEPGSGEMAKSEWKKDKKGNWYYLTSDGSMATDSAVKSKDGDGYYYVDDNGMWDGETLSYQEVKDRGLSIAYKKGTTSATKGLHLMDEEGVGSEAIVTSAGVLRQFDGGETVFSAEQVKNLWAMSKPNYTGLDNSVSVPDYATSQNNAVNINNIINVEGSADEKTVQAIRTALRDDMKDYATTSMFRDIKRAGHHYKR